MPINISIEAATGGGHAGRGAYLGYPAYRVDEIKTSTLKFTGTSREMVLEALMHNTD